MSKNGDGRKVLMRMTELSPEDVRDFWAWVAELNDERGIVRTPMGQHRQPSIANLAFAAGLNPRSLNAQIRFNRVPTEEQAKALARVLGIKFEEMERRIPFRYEFAEYEYCEKCPLLECKPHSGACAMRQAKDVWWLVESAARGMIDQGLAEGHREVCRRARERRKADAE